MGLTRKIWHATTWQAYRCEQRVRYPDECALDSVVHTLSQRPPLVTPAQVEKLRTQLILAASGQAFVLQGGNCAESFNECEGAPIESQLKILSKMSAILLQGLGKPIVQIGRIAGQYAKPRSALLETKNGVSLPSYRGDLINHPPFTLTARTPDPQLLLQGYACAARTHTHIRTHHENRNINFFTSHEALHLYYEQALTRKDPYQKWYNLSTHFPWVGVRTSTLEGAHIEYLRGIENPIGIKVDPAVTPDLLKALIEVLDPHQIPGKITLITRLGVEKVKSQLPKFIDLIQKNRYKVLWSCDPMHGNTKTTASGYKTRVFDDILFELKETFRIHQQMQSTLGGVHLELTGDPVTECVGGASGLGEGDLPKYYKSLVDPRLNYEQSLEIASLITALAHKWDHDTPRNSERNVMA